MKRVKIIKAKDANRQVRIRIDYSEHCFYDKVNVEAKFNKLLNRIFQVTNEQFDVSEIKVV